MHLLRSLLLAMGILLLAGCSSTRHVPEGSYLLDEVDIPIEGDEDVSAKELSNYLKQHPNHEVL
ncbi:MAG: hypothetical protein K2K65_07090, partial [Duncaniella sp.]|nr:hypothetical protein [Duncaniella sp.]